ncbi:MotA/TolQ/ExbB proton channel family protein [Pontiellaceae bacterium B12219]|nr:MotA/TolQ/ExbB proton channel family protein [Pontiellaceae bacterium B12219]
MKRETGSLKRETRNGKSFVLFVSLWLISGSVFAQTADDLLSAAKEKEAQAAAELVALRSEVSKEHAELSEKVKQAYADLALAKADAEQAAFDRVVAEEEFNELKVRGSLDAARNQQLLRELLLAARVAVMLDESWADIQKALNEGIREQLAALFSQTGIREEEMELLDHDGAMVVVPVVRIGNVQTIALGNNPQQRGLVKHTPDGHAYLIGVAPEDAPGTGFFPVDVSRRLETAPQQKSFIQHYLSSGGIFLYPIIAVGLFGLLLVCERMVNMVRHRSPPALMDAVIERAKRFEWDEVHAMVEAQATPLQRVLHCGVHTRLESRDKRESHIENAILEEVPRLERSMTMIAACAAIAPLLGLLGTVTGMIQTFKSLGLDAGGDALSQGISEALITTQVGLVVAVPLLLLHAAFNRVIDRRVIRLEQAGHAMLAVIIEQNGGDSE